jgi:hypothetical protein
MGTGVSWIMQKLKEIVFQTVHTALSQQLWNKNDTMGYPLPLLQ